MGSKFDLPPGAHVREKEESARRQTLEEWDRPQSRGDRIALGLDAEGQLWIAQRQGEAIEIGRPGERVVRTVHAPPTDPERPELSLPRLVGAELLVGSAEGLRLGEELVLPGRFEAYDGAASAGSRVLLASGQPEGGMPGTYWIHWTEAGAAPVVEWLGGPATGGVSVSHDAERIGLAWADVKGAHTIAFPAAERANVQGSLVSYHSGEAERYLSPSIAVDQTGKAYVLFYVMRRDADVWAATREMQLNFERIAFKGSATEDGHHPVNIIHRKRIYMIYGMKPESSTARWRVPGTTMWDGAEHIPGGWPAAVSDGKTLYVATTRGLSAMGSREADEGLDLLSHSWASPEGDVGPQKGIGAKLRRWLGF
jgi:hypothetical protein